jgi:hypothetical protein
VLGGGLEVVEDPLIKLYVFFLRIIFIQTFVSNYILLLIQLFVASVRIPEKRKHIFNTYD